MSAGFASRGRQRAEGLRHGVDRRVNVEVAHERNFQRAARELRGEPGLGLGEVAREHHVLGRQTEARVAAGDEVGHLRRHRAAGRMLETEIHLLKALLRLAQRFRPPAGVGQLGGDELEFQQQVAGRGAAGEIKGIGRGGEPRTDILAREDATEVVHAVLAEPAGAKRAARERAQAALAGRLGDGAAAHAHAGANAAGLEVGLLEVEFHAVRKGHELHVKVGDVLALHDLARRAPVGVGPDGVAACTAGAATATARDFSYAAATAASASPGMTALPETITNRPGAANALRRAARQSATVTLSSTGW